MFDWLIQETWIVNWVKWYMSWDQPNNLALISWVLEEKEGTCKEVGMVPPFSHHAGYSRFHETSWTIQQTQVTITWTVSPIIYSGSQIQREDGPILHHQIGWHSHYCHTCHCSYPCQFPHSHSNSMTWILFGVWVQALLEPEPAKRFGFRCWTWSTNPRFKIRFKPGLENSWTVLQPVYETIWAFQLLRQEPAATHLCWIFWYALVSDPKQKTNKFCLASAQWAPCKQVKKDQKRSI